MPRFTARPLSENPESQASSLSAPATARERESESTAKVERDEDNAGKHHDHHGVPLEQPKDRSPPLPANAPGATLSSSTMSAASSHANTNVGNSHEKTAGSVIAKNKEAKKVTVSQRPFPSVTVDRYGQRQLLLNYHGRPSPAPWQLSPLSFSWQQMAGHIHSTPANYPDYRLQASHFRPVSSSLQPRHPPSERQGLEHGQPVPALQRCIPASFHPSLIKTSEQLLAAPSFHPSSGKGRNECGTGRVERARRRKKNGRMGAGRLKNQDKSPSTKPEGTAHPSTAPDSEDVENVHEVRVAMPDSLLSLDQDSMTRPHAHLAQQRTDSSASSSSLSTSSSSSSSSPQSSPTPHRRPSGRHPIAASGTGNGVVMNPPESTQGSAVMKDVGQVAPRRLLELTAPLGKLCDQLQEILTKILPEIVGASSEEDGGEVPSAPKQPRMRSSEENATSCHPRQSDDGSCKAASPTSSTEHNATALSLVSTASDSGTDDARDGGRTSTVSDDVHARGGTVSHSLLQHSQRIRNLIVRIYEQYLLERDELRFVLSKKSAGRAAPQWLVDMAALSFFPVQRQSQPASEIAVADAAPHEKELTHHTQESDVMHKVIADRASRKQQHNDGAHARTVVLGSGPAEVVGKRRRDPSSSSSSRSPEPEDTAQSANASSEISGELSSAPAHDKLGCPAQTIGNVAERSPEVTALLRMRLLIVERELRDFEGHLFTPEETQTVQLSLELSKKEFEAAMAGLEVRGARFTAAERMRRRYVNKKNQRNSRKGRQHQLQQPVVSGHSGLGQQVSSPAPSFAGAKRAKLQQAQPRKGSSVHAQALCAEKRDGGERRGEGASNLAKK